MSIDFHVFTSRAATESELSAVIGGIPGLNIQSPTPGGGAVVVRGARQLYCCTIEDPLVVDPIDVPDEVVAAVLNVSVQYDVLVEGSRAADVAPAKRVARGLAALLGGALHDPQEDTFWSSKSGRIVSAPAKQERVRIIDVDWCFAASEVSERTISGLLALCRRYLPEALPRRFGSYEPLQGRFADHGEDGLIDAWSRSGGSLFWNARLPCTGGTLGEAPIVHGHPAWSISLAVLSEPVETSPGWRNALQAFFVATGEELDAFYACAQVTGQHIWARGGTWGDSETESRFPVGARWWRGLPPQPVWWSWYGQNYAPIMHDLLDPGSVTQTTTGLLHVASELPRTRRELEAAGSPAPPDELVARAGRRPAQRIPGALETLAGKGSIGDEEYVNHDPEERARRRVRGERAAAEQVLVDQLQANGVVVESLGDFAIVGDHRIRQPVAIGVLVNALDSELPQHVKDDVVFYLSLARTAAADAWPRLRDMYLAEPASSLFKFRLGAALAHIVNRARLPELIELANDDSMGASRVRLLPALKRFKDPDAAAAFERLRDDPDVADPPDI